MDSRLKVAIVGFAAVIIGVLSGYLVITPSLVKKEKEVYVTEVSIQFEQFEHRLDLFKSDTAFALERLTQVDGIYEDSSQYTTYLNAVQDGFTFDPNANEQEIIDAFNIYVEGNPNVDSIYVGFEDSGSFVRTLPIQADSNPGEGIFDYDPRVRSWYVNALASPGEVVFNDVDKHPTEDVYYSTISTAIYDDDDNLVGVIGLDIQLQYFLENFKESSVLDRGEYVYLQGDKVVQFANSNLILNQLGEVLEGFELPDTNDKGVYSSSQTINGKDTFVIVSITSNPNVKFVHMIDEDEITAFAMAQVAEVRNLFIVITLLLLAIMLITTNQSFVKPLSRLQNQISEFNKVDHFNYEFKAKGKSGEFVDVSNTLNNMIEKMRTSQHDVRERIKELTCLYKVSNVSRNSEDLKEIFEETVFAMKEGWHYPEVTEAKILYFDDIYKTSEFTETKWVQSADIISSGEVVGSLNVYYTEEKPEIDEGPFMKEERDLINTLAQTINIAISSKNYQEGLKKKNEEFEEQLIERTKELRENEQNMKSIFDSSLDAIMVVDDESGHYLTSNQAAREMYRIPDEIDITTIHAAAFSPEQQPNGKTSGDMAIENTRKTKELGGHKVEWLAKRYDGTEFPSHLSLSPTVYQEKDAINVIVRDITELKKNELQDKVTARLMADMMLKDSIEEKLEIITDSLQEMFNQEFARIWMVCQGEGCADCVHVSEDEDKLCNVEGCINIVSTKEGFDKYLRKDGSVVYGNRTMGRVLHEEEQPFYTNEAQNDLRITGKKTLKDIDVSSYAVQRIHLPNGEIAGILEVFGTEEITENDYERITALTGTIGQVQAADIAEKEILEVQNKVAESQKLMENTIEALTHPFYVIDAETYEIKLANTAALRRNKFETVTTCHKLTHRSDEPCCGDKDPCPLRKVKETGEPFVVEHIHYDENDNEEFVEVHGYPIFDDNGKVISMIEYSLNITERKEAEKQLEEARVIAENATKAKSDFLANMSHEIRTPMNAIIGLTNLLEKTKLDTKQTDYVTKTSRAATNLLGIINDILDFSKIEAGKLDIESIEFSLDEVLDNISSVVGLKAFDKGIEFIIAKNYLLPNTLIGDPLRIGQVLLNLVNNAIKFTEDGQVLLKVEELKSEDKKVTLRFTVNDTGIGMTEEQVNKLFKAFQQADTSTTRKYGGTGLGLSISKNLVEKMGGTIWAESVAGEGSTFGFEIVFELGQKTKLRKLVIPEGLKNIKALIVDDNEDARMVVESYLNGFGIDSAQASNGEEAIKMIDDSFDIVLLDWKMPGLNGDETWKLIQKKLPKAPEVIMLTAYGRESVLKSAREVGIEEILMKPVSQSYLFNSILKMFGEELNVSEYKRNGDLVNLDPIRGARILVAEDNEINQQVAKETLENEGFYVDIAENGKVAVELMESNEYDLIFMDLQMPIMSGYESSKAIRKMGFTDIPIVALSADAMSGVLDRVSEAGMNGFVSKPIILNELFAALKQYIIEDESRVVNEVEKEEFSIEFKQYLSRFKVDEALNRLANNHKSYFDILSKYSSNYSNFLPEFKVTLKEDKETAKRDIHSLKGVSGNIGATETHELSKELESKLKEGQSISRLKKLTSLGESIEQDTKEISQLIKNTSFSTNDEVLSDDVLISKLELLLEQLDEYETSSEETVLEVENTLKQKGYDIEDILSNIRNYEFEECIELVKDILQKIRG